MTTTVAAIAARVAEIGPEKIDAKTLDTLRDMCKRALPYGGTLTPKQADYARTLLDRAAIRREQTGRNPIDLTRINAMFETAAKHKKSPKVYFLAGDAEFSVAPAKAGSANPGFLYAKQGSTYLGKISPTGAFSPSRDASEGILSALETFAADPAAAAAAYGRETSRCCFCAKKLEDPRSVAAGFGPDCAANHGLSWGRVDAQALGEEIDLAYGGRA